MKSFITFTTAYDEIEDRISVTGSCQTGDTVQVWLNLRLMQRVLPHIIEWLKKSDRTGGGQADQIHGFKQQSARDALPLQPPVMPAGNTEKWLVRTLDLNWDARQIDLVFKGIGADQVATIALPLLAARQWLNIVSDLYKMADWPLSVWPDWIAETTTTPAITDIVRH